MGEKGGYSFFKKIPLLLLLFTVPFASRFLYLFYGFGANTILVPEEEVLRLSWLKYLTLSAWGGSILSLVVPFIVSSVMLVDYTGHALSRMRQRKISKRSVEETLERPEFSFVTYEGKTVVLKRYGDKFLKVVYEKNKDKIRVITVYWTRRMRTW